MVKFVMLAALVAAAAPAAAEPASSRSSEVQVRDLDLGTQSGLAQLNKRIARVIDDVCGSYKNVTDPNDLDEVFVCRTAAKASASRQVEERLAGLKAMASRSPAPSGTIMAANNR